MFIYATLNITFYCIAFKQNISGCFGLIWKQHLTYNPFHSYPSLRSTQSWVSWGSSESPAEAVKPLLLQTNIAHCSLSFQFHFLYGECCLGSIICQFSLSHSLLSLISSLSLLFHQLCLAGIVYWYKNNTKTRPAHTNYMSISRGQGLSGSHDPVSPC